MKVLAFDANSIVNRAFYGVRLLSTREGTYTNAVYGFFNIVYKLIEEQKPDAVAFAFDLHAPTFRHKMYEPYKGISCLTITRPTERGCRRNCASRCRW